jgi:hypothetical protein
MGREVDYNTNLIYPMIQELLVPEQGDQQL